MLKTCGIWLLLSSAGALCAAEPAWWLQRPQPEGTLVGLGAGANPEAAKIRAIVDLVESLAVDVSSRRQSTATEKTINGESQLSAAFEQKLQTSSSIRDLPGLVLAAQATDGDMHYAQVRLAEQILLPELARRCTSLTPTYLPLPSPPTWAWVIAARRELAILRERERLTTILASRGYSVPPSVPDAKRMADDLGMLANTLEVTVLGTESPALEAVKAALSKTALTQTAVAPVQVHPTTAIARSRNERGWHQAQMTVTISIRSTTGVEYALLPCAVSGISTKDPASADLAAVARLEPALDSLFSNQFLQIFLSHHLE